MIRRISKYNDLKDVITAKQPNVIENVDEIWYYIQGYPDNTISPEWSVSGEVINVIIPTDLLEELPNGILMRIVHYHKENADYPDGYYDLEIEDNMGIWLGEDESDTGGDGSSYVTESELSTTLKGYATQSWVEGKGYLTSHQDLTSYALKTDIPSLSGYATESWVSNQGYLTAVSLSGYALKADIPSLSGYATQSWVEGKGYPQASWVTSYVSSALSTYTTQSYLQSYVSSALSTYSYTETDPTVPSWAKSATKPTYTASEVSALALSAVWTGTSTEWEALTSAQQALYTIALITE